MKEKVYNIDDSLKKREREIKKARRKEEISQKFEKLMSWADNNKETIAVCGSLGVGVLGITKGLVGTVGKSITLKKEANNKELYCYDRSLGHYWELRRKLTNREWVEIDQRKKNGERLADILSELKVLK